MTLYTHQTQTYRIPPHETLPPGDCLIRSLDGKEELRVDETALAQYAISQAEANDYLKAKLSQSLDDIKNSFQSALTLKRQEIKAKQEGEAERPPSPLVKALLGFNAEDIKDDPTVAEAGLRELLSEVKTVIEGASDDPAKQAAAQAQMKALRARFEENGIATTAEMENLPDKLRQALQAESRAERQTDIAVGLEEISAQLKQAATAAGDFLDQEADKIRNQESEIRD